MDQIPEAVTQRTWSRTSFAAYLTAEHPPGSAASRAARQAEIEARNTRLAAFPHTLLLQLSHLEMDLANRWCWQQFGPAHGCCRERFSAYPACQRPGLHAHEGRWTGHWLAKTADGRGYNEWHFSSEADRDRFAAFLTQLAS